MKKSEILRKAAELVTKPEEYSEYLCDCITRVVRWDNEDGQQIKDYISSLIECQYGIDVWLLSKGVPAVELWKNPEANDYRRQPTEKLQQYRKAFALHLAQEYEMKGE